MRFAAIVLLLPALSLAAPRTPSHEALRTQCLLNAADPKNPWALAHGMTAFGRDFAASDGRKAVDVIAKDFLLKSDDPKTGAYAFKRYEADGTPVDPHTNLIVKTFVLAGMKDGQKLKTPYGDVKVGDLVKSAQQGFRHVPTSEAYWEDVGWTLDLFAERMTPRAAKFQNGAGETVDLNEVMDTAFAYLEVAQRDLAEGMDKHMAEVPKRKQGIYAHSCGGMHLIQAVIHWARFPEVRKKWGARLDKQIDVLFYRLGSEQRQYEAALRQAPQYKLQLLTQMLKFYGHFLETTGRMRSDLKWKPNEAQARDLQKAKALLDWTTKELQASGAFDHMADIRKQYPQVYLDLIGDACHAAHGLELWR